MFGGRERTWAQRLEGTLYIHTFVMNARPKVIHDAYINDMSICWMDFLCVGNSLSDTAGEGSNPVRNGVFVLFPSQNHEDHEDDQNK